MKKFLLLSLILLLGYHQIFSQSWRRVGSWGNEFSGIKWINNEVGYIAGDNIILKSSDGGLSWMEKEAPGTEQIIAFDFVDENNGILLGSEGQIFRTVNGGQNWQIGQVSTTSTLTGIYYLSPSEVFISGANGSLFKSQDGGISWEMQELGVNSDLNAFFFLNRDLGFVATSGSEIIKTKDGGNTWQIYSTGFESALNDLYFISDSVGFAVGNMGAILKTENGGLDWQYINSGMDTDYTTVSFNRSNPQQGVIAGKNGTVLRTINGGLTFAEINSRTNQNINSLSFRQESDMVFAVGASGVLISSSNSGGSWTLRFSGRDNHYTSLQFTTDLRGYLTGQNGLILLTGNGGATFTDRSRSLSLPFNALHFVSGTAGYVSGNNGNILSTTNSGGTWTALNPGTNRNINGIHFFDINRGYVVGDRGFISHTENRGVQWNMVPSGENSIHFKDIKFFDQEQGIIVGDEGYISRSEDGSQWSKVNSATTENINALEILDENSAIVVGDNGLIMKSSDKGRTWDIISTPFQSHFNDVEFLDESVGFIAANKGTILRTFDAGETWEKLPTGTYQNFTGVSFGDLNTGYAAGEFGTFFQYSCQVPEQPITISGETNICLSQQIYTIPDMGEQGTSYEWRVDGGTVIEGQGSTRAVIRWDSPGRNAVMVRGQNNCGNGNTKALEVVVSKIPEQTTTIHGDGVVCLNNIEEYYLDSIPGMEYVWQATGGVVRRGQGSPKITIEWTSLDEQSLKVSPRNPCGDGPTSEKMIRVITMPTKPSPIEGQDRVGLQEADYEINPLPDINYQWSLDDEGGKIISGQGSSKIRILWEKEGDHVLSVTPLNACNEGPSQQLEVNVNLITSHQIEQYENFIKIYPSPSTGDIHISAKGISGLQEISIYNSMGQLVRHISVESGNGEFFIQNIPKGLHSVILRSRKKEYYKTVLIF